jgi:hypothetical protein
MPSTASGSPPVILRRLMIDRATVAAVARELGLSCDTVYIVTASVVGHKMRHTPSSGKPRGSRRTA